MIDKKMEKALNKHVNEEMFSYYLYLSMSAHLTAGNLPGFGSWLYQHAHEELGHAMKVFNFILGRGGKVKLEQVKGPKTEWKTPLQVFEEIYDHECHITKLVNDLVDLSIKEKDHATNAFLQWFVNEQVEEEAMADEIVAKLKLVGDQPGGLYLVDRELAEKSAAMAATAGA